jgi:hypothetical protein
MPQVGYAPPGRLIDMYLGSNGTYSASPYDEEAARQASTPMLQQQAYTGPVWQGTIAGQSVYLPGASNEAQAYDMLRQQNSDLLSRGGLKPDFAQALYGFDGETLKAYKKAHKAFNEATDMDSSVEKIGKAARFEWDRAKNIVRQAADSPTQMVFGVDPIGTKIGNTVTGQNNEAIVGQFGGATNRDFERYAAENGRDSLGAARSLSTMADYVAALGGAAGATHGLAQLYSAAAPGATTGTTAASAPASSGSGAYYGSAGSNYVGGFAPAAGESVTVGTQGLGSLVGSTIPGTTSALGSATGATASAGGLGALYAGGGAAAAPALAGGFSSGGGIFANGGAAGTAGVGGGNAGALASSGGITGGAGMGSAAGGSAGGGVGGSAAGAGGMAWTDWIGPATSALTSIYGNERANDATREATRAAIEENRRQFDLVRGDTAPARALGAAAIGNLSDLYGYNESGTPNMARFFTSPDFQFNVAEGQQAIDRSAAARGGLLSGAAVKEGQRYASGLASREYGSYVDRLLQQAGLGNTGIGASAAAGANATNNITGATLNAGNARASGYMDTAANVNNAIQSGYSNYMLRRYLGN